MQLVLNTMGLRLKVKNGLFHVRGGDQARSISPERLGSIAVTAPCLLSSAAVRLAAESNIPIYFFDRYGDADACLRSPYFESLATLRRKQVYFSDRREGADWVIRQFELKTEGQIANLKFLANRRPSLAKPLLKASELIGARTRVLGKDYRRPPSKNWTAKMMGWEGQTARLYWQAMGPAPPRGWSFERRSRRPALDPFNAMLNYFYGMLYAMTERALFSAGLDPHLGILHADEYDRPTLSYDLIEAFRPWVDRFLLEVIISAKLSTDVVEEQGDGYWLSNAAKRSLIPKFNTYFQTRKRWNGRQSTREGQIFRTAAELAQLIDRSMKRPA